MWLILIILIILVILYNRPELLLLLTNWTSTNTLNQQAATTKYYIEDNPAEPDFIWETRKILTRNTAELRHPIKEVRDANSADVIIKVVDRLTMIQHSKPSEFYPNGDPVYLSWTYYTRNPKEIWIDMDNWRFGVDESGLTLQQYRQYVILHEFLHALGYDHQPCESKVCPIMYQSTKGCPRGSKCGYQITDLDFTKKIQV